MRILILLLGTIAAYGQISPPPTNAPSGAAGGNLSGTYPNPVVAKINGTTVTTNAAANQVALTTAAAVTAWTSIPACLDSAGQHLNFNTTTHAFSCGTSGGTPRLDQITDPNTSKAFTMGVNPLNFNFTGDYGSGYGFSVSSNAANPSTGPLGLFSSGTGTTHNALEAASNGTGFGLRVSAGNTLLGPPESTLDPLIQGYTGGVNLITHSGNNQAALGVEAQSSGLGVGIYSVHMGQDAGIESDIWANGDGQLIDTFLASAHTNGFATDTLTGFNINSINATSGGGSLINGIGLNIGSILNATNNWAIKTSLGKVEFGDTVIVAPHTPASSSEACTAGQFSDDADYHYVCTATNTWKRVALSSF